MYIIGGSGVIGQEFETALSTMGVAQQIRLGGADQFKTNIAIVQELSVKSGTPVVIASAENYPDALAISSFAAHNKWPILMVPTWGLTGYNYPDALAGSVLAAQQDSPLVLINPDLMELPLPIQEYIAELHNNGVKPDPVALGGSHVVTQWVLSSTEQIIDEGVVSRQGIPPRRVDKETITISAVGDNTLGTDPSFGYPSSFTQAFDQKGPDYFFSGVKDVFQKDDLTIANLETTLTRATKKSYKGPNGAGFFFKGDPSYTSILKAGSIEAVDVGNNHSMDFLEQGLNDTFNNLQKANIGAFGRGKSYVFETKGIHIGMLGYILLGCDDAELKQIKEQITEQIAELRKTCQIVVVSFHWGIENEYDPTDLQREFGHYAIDAGADLVIGHHPHVLQPIEKYKDHYVFYSLGNFSFGGIFNPWDRDTAIVQQSFTFANGELWDVSPLNVIPCSISSASWRNDYRPRLVEGEEATRVLRKLN